MRSVKATTVLCRPSPLSSRDFSW